MDWIKVGIVLVFTAIAAAFVFVLYWGIGSLCAYFARQFGFDKPWYVWAIGWFLVTLITGGVGRYSKNSSGGKD